MGVRDREHGVARAVFVISSVVTALLYAVPQLNLVAYPLLVLSTVAHETGHGLAALAVGGAFESFELYPDGSGVAHVTGIGSRAGQAIVSAGGLVGPAIAAALAFVAGRRPGVAQFFLSALFAATLIALVLVVRNLFGWLFLGGFAILLGLLVFRTDRRWSQIALVFLGTQLGLSVFSRSDYLFTRAVHTPTGSMPSDVAQIAEMLLMPYWFWGMVCGAVRLTALLIGVRALWARD